jgi:branched-chain amino acid transport system ATP-binding protein
MVLLDIRQINCFYGKSQILWDVSMTVNADEIVAVVGSNGAGKTTLLRAISGLHKISSGSISWKGKEIVNTPPHQILEWGISQVPEGAGIFPYMTVLENLKTGAYSKKNWKNRFENLEKVFALFPELKERRNQSAGTLSGGERQMLGIGKGLMSSPELLIFDEPSFGLAPRLVLKLFETISEISKRGVTIFLVEQNVHHAMSLSHRTYVLENGRMVKGGDSKILLEDDHVRKAYLGV